jgi:hypothetical protein
MAEGVGNYACACGQEYRFAARVAGRLDFWPRSGPHAYRREPLGDPQCIRCGSVLPAMLEAPTAAAPSIGSDAEPPAESLQATRAAITSPTTEVTLYDAI